MVQFETILTYSYYFEEDNLLFVKLKNDPDLTVQNIILHNEQSFNALGEKSTKTIYDVRNLLFTHIPKEVLSYVADSPYGKYQLSEAFIINGLGQKMIANFYLKAMKPKVKSRIFNTVLGALEWLEIKNTKPIVSHLNSLEDHK